jgi:hypothetical protein
MWQLNNLKVSICEILLEVQFCVEYVQLLPHDNFEAQKASLIQNSSCIFMVNNHTELQMPIFYILWVIADRLCGLEVRVPNYNLRGSGTIPGTTRFSEK